MSRIGDFRAYVAGVLAPALGIDFVDGKLSGPIERKPVACTFPLGKDEVPGQVDDEMLYVGVRVFKTFRQKRAVRVPAVDPGPYEDLAELVQTTMQQHQTAGGLWFNRVVSIDLSMIEELHMIEVTIMGYQQNLAVVGETAAP